MSTLIATTPIDPIYFRLTERVIPDALRRVGEPESAAELVAILKRVDAQPDELVDALDTAHAAVLVRAAAAGHTGDAATAASLEQISVLLQHVLVHEAMHAIAPHTSAIHLARAIALARDLGLLGHDGGPGGGGVAKA